MTDKNDKQVFGRFLRTKNDQKNRPRDSFFMLLTLIPR